jgi:hypothetical protein
MPKQGELMADGEGGRPKRGRKSSTHKPSAGADAKQTVASEVAAAPAGTTDESASTAFEDVAYLEKKGYRVVPVVTGAVVDSGGNFLFYIDGHDDARAAVQAQINHLLESGPSREEHLAAARARARFLADKLSRPR